MMDRVSFVTLTNPDNRQRKELFLFVGVVPHRSSRLYFIYTGNQARASPSPLAQFDLLWPESKTSATRRRPEVGRNLAGD
jgi:hypothetical protein